MCVKISERRLDAAPRCAARIGKTKGEAAISRRSQLGATAPRGRPSAKLPGMSATAPSAAGATARWSVVAGLTTVALPSAVVASVVGDPPAQRIMRAWSRASLATLGLSLTVDDRNRGHYHDAPYLFVHLNQTSLLESFLFPAVCPVLLRMVINVEFALLPVLGVSLAALGSRVIVRQLPDQAKRVMDAVARDMRERRWSFGISIEGRRSVDGELSPYKKGSAFTAIAAQARIVPFYLYGAFDAMPYGAFRVRPGPIHAVLFEPIETRGLTLDDRDALTARLRDIAERARVDDPRRRSVADASPA